MSENAESAIDLPAIRARAAPGVPAAVVVTQTVAHRPTTARPLSHRRIHRAARGRGGNTMSARGETFDCDFAGDGLYELSELLGRRNPDAQSHGLLGGEWGYGQDFRNEVFAMHPFCWCERDDCEWCAGCECPESAFHWFVDASEVTWDEWIAFYKSEVGPDPDYGNHDECQAHNARGDEVNKRRTRRHDAVCRYCRGEFGNAPHFYHFASGLRIWWYKYIGRSMEASQELSRPDWRRILGECIDSFTATSDFDSGEPGGT